jgi:hypothetical protein
MRTRFSITLATAVLLLASAPVPTVAGTGSLSAQKALKKPPRISQKMIDEARRSGDEFDACMNNPDSDSHDYIELLGACFCLTTETHNPACGGEYEPDD